MDIHGIKRVTDAVQDGLSGLMKNGQIMDYSATVRIGEDLDIDVYYMLNRPLKFIRTDIRLSKPID
jgi:hypothetical protein